MTYRNIAVISHEYKDFQNAIRGARVTKNGNYVMGGNNYIMVTELSDVALKTFDGYEFTAAAQLNNDNFLQIVRLFVDRQIKNDNILK